MNRDPFANDMYYRSVNAEDKVRVLQNLLIKVWDDYAKVGYGASHEDVEAFKDMRSKVNAALDGDWRERS